MGYIKNCGSVHFYAEMKHLFVILCAIVATTVATPLSKTDRDVTTCLLCKVFIGQIDDTIIDPSNEQAVADALKGICGVLFPNDIDKQNNCKNVIDNSLPQIIETIVNDYGDPEAICTSLT